MFMCLKVAWGFQCIYVYLGIESRHGCLVSSLVAPTMHFKNYLYSVLFILCVWVHIHTWPLLPSHQPSTLFFNMVSLNLELTNWVRLASHEVSSYLHLASYKIYRCVPPHLDCFFKCEFWGLTLGLSGCKTSTVLTEPFLQPRSSFF